MNILKILAVSITVVFINALLRKTNKELNICVSIAGGLYIIYETSKYLSPVIEQINKYTNIANIDSSVLSIVFKITGICFISSFVIQSCRDNGENALAIKVETFIKVVILFISIPLFSKIIDNFSVFLEV